MSKTLTYFLIALLIVSLFSPWPTRGSSQETVPPAFPIPSPLLIDDAAATVAHATRSVELAHTRLSPTMKKLIAGILSSIASQRFPSLAHRRQWIALIGVESGYDGRARSPTGAVGLGQLLPKYREDFGQSCGMTGVTNEDITDDFTNLSLSACYFKWLIDQNGGNSDLAMVSYVSGLYSEDVAKAKTGRAPSETARQYVKQIHKHAQEAK